MKVAIIRHGKVDYEYRKRSTSSEYDRDCLEYDKAPLRRAEYPVPAHDYRKIYVSTLPRSQATARGIFGHDNYVVTGWIDEVPLSSCFDTRRKLPVWFWNVAARLQWFFNCSRQQEVRIQTERRIKWFLDMILKDNVDCAVVTHGFYMHFLVQKMKKTGFTLDNDHIHYKNGECVIAEFL